jgi:CRISPR-associated protein Csb2
MLALDVEFLTGVCVSTQWGTLHRVEFPPQPVRLFRALVAAWADGGQDEEERSALTVLEACGAPEVIAPRLRKDHERMGTNMVYVPPNDVSTTGRPGAALPKGKALKEALYPIPAYRTNRQARAFPAMALPDDERIVRYVWRDASMSDAMFRALHRVGRRVSYVGHSHSLTRVYVHTSAEALASGMLHLVPVSHRGRHQMGVPVAGELARLQMAHAANIRPGAATWQSYAEHSPPASASSNVFSDEWIVLVPAEGIAPALTAMPYVADTLRRALLARADSLPTGDDFPEVLKRTALQLISGHAPDGRPLTQPHLAIIPLANLGNRFATGRVLGVALVPPRLESAAESDLLQDVLRACIGSTELTLTLGQFGVWTLKEHIGTPDRQSIDPERYSRRSTTWTTATPLVLDRHPKRDGDAEATVAAACAHIGLGTPRSVLLHKHCALTGGEPAWPRARSGGWARRWKQDGARADAFGGRPLTHATIEFEDSVEGPVILGAGRYLGLGLCVPTPRTERTA